MRAIGAKWSRSRARRLAKGSWLPSRPRRSGDSRELFLEPRSQKIAAVAAPTGVVMGAELHSALMNERQLTDLKGKSLKTGGRLGLNTAHVGRSTARKVVCARRGDADCRVRARSRG